MDLRLFHPTGTAGRSTKIMDRFNSWTRYIPCHFLEWYGWYYASVRIRLLGHYRLYQHYKNYNHDGVTNGSSPLGYLLRQRTVFESKYKDQKYPEYQAEIYVTNRILLNEKSPILFEFLTEAETDFEEAFKRAMEQIHSPEFLNNAPPSPIPSTKVLVQVNHDHNTNNYHHTSYSNNELNIYPVVEKAPVESVFTTEPSPTSHAFHGKEKGVFSKNQVLIFFDLLSRSARIERLDLSKPNKFDAFAEFLQALTGKSKETWLEELKNYRNKDLYGFHTADELKSLLRTLTNLSRILHKAGFKTLTSQVDDKIEELEKKLPPDSSQ